MAALLGSAGIGVAFAPQTAGATSGGVTTPTQLVSTATTECPSSTSGCTATTLGAGVTLKVTFNEAVAIAAPSLTLTDGTSEGVLGPSAMTATASGSSITFTVTAAPTMQTGSSLTLKNLEILAETGVTATGDGSGWNLVASGEIDKSSTSSTCVPVNERMFGGTNCSIGSGASGPTSPDVYDVIALPTADLPGPPDDNAPEVITNCQAGSTDTVYALAGAGQLGTQACGDYPAGESGIGNTTSNTLDYIPTPGLSSFVAVGVVETIPGSFYVSATTVPPVITSVSVSGSQATFGYSTPVVCQAPGASQTVSQFTYASPWWSTARSSLVYPSSVTCPSGTSSTTLIANFPSAIPTSVRFKYEAYGSGYFVVGSSSSPLAGEREASQSFYVGPASSPPNPTISSLTGPTVAPTASGGTFAVDFTTAGATQCSLTSSPSAGVSISIPYTPAPSNPPAESAVPCPTAGTSASITLPANTGSAGITYTLTLTATGLAGSTPAIQTLPITVPSKTGSTTTTTTLAPTTTTAAPTTTTLAPTTTTAAPTTTTAAPTTTTLAPTTTTLAPTTTTAAPTTTTVAPTTTTSSTTTTTLASSAPQFDFEDGTPQGWTLHYGPATVANTATVAFSGTHSLAITLTGAGNPGVGSAAGLTGLASGTKVTYHVYEPAGVSVQVNPFAVDTGDGYHFTSNYALTPGAWTTITWTVPTTTAAISWIAMEIENGGGAKGTLALDAVSWNGGVPATTTTTLAPTTTTTSSTTTTTLAPTTTTTSSTTTTTLAPTTTTAAPTTTLPPPTSQFDFEDGTTQGWTVDYGPATVANTATVAYSGTHSLAITLTGAGNPGIISPSTVTGISSGTKVTYHVYEPAGVSVAVDPYVVDANDNYYFTGNFALKAGAWTTITWTVPTLSAKVAWIGMEVENGGGANGVLNLDAVSW